MKTLNQYQQLAYEYENSIINKQQYIDKCRELDNNNFAGKIKNPHNEPKNQEKQ